jgi:hypothetical protein
MTKPIIQFANVLRAAMMVATVLAVTIITAEAEPNEPLPNHQKDVFSAEFSYESKIIDVLGSKMHYIDQRAKNMVRHCATSLGHDHRAMLQRVVPDRRIGDVEHADVRDVFGRMASLGDHPR